MNRIQEFAIARATPQAKGFVPDTIYPATKRASHARKIRSTLPEKFWCGHELSRKPDGNLAIPEPAGKRGLPPIEASLVDAMNALPKAIIELTGLPLMPAKRTSLRRILAALCSIRSRLLGAVQNAYAENLPGTEVRSHYASAASREFRFRCQLVIDDAALLSQFVWEFGWPAIEPLIVETVDRLPDAIFELGQLQAAELTVVHLEKAITALSCMHRVLLNACVQDPCVDIHSIPSRAD